MDFIHKQRRMVNILAVFSNRVCLSSEENVPRNTRKLTEVNYLVKTTERTQFSFGTHYYKLLFVKVQNV